jgi:hypothetical protein
VNTKSIILFFILGFTVCSAYADGVTGLFTNLRYNKSDGEFTGMEFFIFPSKTGYWALVQIAQGARFHALVALTTNKNDIEFTLPADSAHPGAHFVGKVDGDALVGGFTDGALAAAGQTKLKRGKSFWN